jgi:hypothetical protein
MGRVPECAKLRAEAKFPPLLFASAGLLLVKSHLLLLPERPGEAQKTVALFAA